MHIRDIFTVSKSELFDMAAREFPDRVYAVKSYEQNDEGDYELVHMADARVIALEGGGGLYVDDIDGYKIMDDLDLFDCDGTELVQETNDERTLLDKKYDKLKGLTQLLLSCLTYKEELTNQDYPDIKSMNYTNNKIEDVRSQLHRIIDNE